MFSNKEFHVPAQVLFVGWSRLLIYIQATAVYTCAIVLQKSAHGGTL